jgi:hypothetical protein
MADFNVEPEEWSKLAWLERNGAAIVLPEGAEATCRKGRGTLIDYAIMSKNLVPIVKRCQGVDEVPWAPHIGIRLVISAEPKKVLVRKLMRPRLLVGPAPGEEQAIGRGAEEEERAAEDMDPRGGRRRVGPIGLQDRPEVWARAVRKQHQPAAQASGPRKGRTSPRRPAPTTPRRWA